MAKKGETDEFCQKKKKKKDDYIFEVKNLFIRGDEKWLKRTRAKRDRGWVGEKRRN